MILYTSLVFAFSGAQAAPPATHPAAVPAKQAPAPKEQLQEVAYEDLAKYLNQRLVIRTTLHTERRGTLVKYSGTAIDLKLDSGATLGLPRDTIRSIGVPAPPPDLLIPEKK